jgi:hypothetical protein
MPAREFEKPKKKKPLPEAITKQLKAKANPVAPDHAPTGKPAGPMRTTAVLKDAILYAAQKVGSDGRGLNGLVGYLTFCARFYPKEYITLLGKVLPLQIVAESKVVHEYRSSEEIKRDLAERGVPIDRIFD